MTREGSAGEQNQEWDGKNPFIFFTIIDPGYPVDKCTQSVPSPIPRYRRIPKTRGCGCLALRILFKQQDAEHL